MIDIRCSRDGLKCDDCPIIKECEHIELTEEIDAYSLYEKGRSDQKEEDNEFFNFEGAWELEKKKVRADALNIDMEKPMHFTDEQKAWVKNYIIINAKRQRADAIEEIKELAQQYLIGMMNLENATKYGNKNAEQQDISYGTLMRYEIADCVDDFMDSLEKLKEQRNEL